MEYIILTGLLAFLGAASLADLRYRQLDFIFLCISFTAGFVLQTFSGLQSGFEILAGAALGAAAVLLSALSRGRIGYGDSFMIAICGVWLGFSDALLTVLCALLITAVFAAAALVLKKLRIKDSLPFAPFLLAGYVVVLAVK